MDIGMLHTHHLLVVLYIILLALKVVLVTAGQKHALTTLNGRTRVTHIVLASLMLATGLYLMFKSPVGLAPHSIVKYVILLAGIALGVVGVKRMSIPLSVLALLAFGYVYGIAKTRSMTLTPEKSRIEAVWEAHAAAPPTARGQAIYEAACIRCHGPAGDAQYRKAANLKGNEKPDPYKRQVIEQGLNTMPGYGYMTDEQLDAVVAYINTL